MSFQIKDIVVYSKGGQKKVVSLKIGELNIITGASKTGKSALIEIIDYCLGSKECKIPEGVIRETVSWVGLRLKITDGMLFIARKVHPKQSFSSDIYYTIGKNVEIPEFSQLIKNINLDGLREFLTEITGIEDNRNEVPKGQTRLPLFAHVRHALLYCFQAQEEIINKKCLFHNQSEPFVSQSIKDTIPYFLGAVDDDHVKKQIELRTKKQKLKNLERQLSEYESIKGEGVSKANNLISEARDVGLFSQSRQTKDWEDCVSALTQIKRSPVLSEEDIIEKGGQEFDDLQRERKKLSNKYYLLREQLRASKELALERDDYSKESVAQLGRLKGIELFDEQLDSLEYSCPFCNSKIESKNSSPMIKSIKNSFNRLTNEIRNVEDRSPQMQKVVRVLEEEIESLKLDLLKNREAIEAVQKSNIKLQTFEDHGVKRAYIMGRIALYLESLPQLKDTSALKKDISKLQEEIDTLEDELSQEITQEKIDSILSLISQDMSCLSKDLDLEHSEHPLRLNLKKLTIVSDRKQGPIPMDRMGSGENWVGYHLITHLILHKWFIKEQRPVPSFLFIDQPSQIYFPEDSAWDDSKKGEDREKVGNIYKLVLKMIQELTPNLQVIITDHANINEQWFQDSVVERWRDGQKLVPPEWVKGSVNK